MGVQFQRAFAAVSVLVASGASADFTGFVLSTQVTAGTLDTYRIVRVHARFDVPTEVLLNVFDATMTLTYQGSAVPGLLQATDPDLELGPSFRPFAFVPSNEPWMYDSYVTIGAEQGDPSGTVLDPGFDDSGAAEGLGFGGASGWYNLPPTNGLGTAGSDLRVFIGQFVVPSAAFVPGLRLYFSGTVGANCDNLLKFGEHEASVAIPAAAAPKYVIDDFDADEMSDLILFSRPKGELSAWLMSGPTPKSTAVIEGAPRKGYTLQGIGDTDGDGDADVIWRAPRTNILSAWRMQGTKIPDEYTLGPSLGRGWTVLACTDISGDAIADVLFFNRGTRQVHAWLLGPDGIDSEGPIGAMPTAMPLGVGDFDGDGMRDILWRTPTGEVSAWLLDGLAIRESGPITDGSEVSRAWKVAGIGDFDGDGSDDVLWRQARAGEVVLWRMEGLRCMEIRLLSNSVPAAWSCEACPDVDGDGRRDVVWRRRKDGTMLVWRMLPDGDFLIDFMPSADRSITIGRPKMN